MQIDYKGKPKLTSDQKRAQYLANLRYNQSILAQQYLGHLQNVYHPITLKDGTYWRNGKWNKSSVIFEPCSQCGEHRNDVKARNFGFGLTLLACNDCVC